MIDFPDLQNAQFIGQGDKHLTIPLLKMTKGNFESMIGNLFLGRLKRLIRVFVAQLDLDDASLQSIVYSRCLRIMTHFEEPDEHEIPEVVAVLMCFAVRNIIIRKQELPVEEQDEDEADEIARADDIEEYVPRNDNLAQCLQISGLFYANEFLKVTRVLTQYVVPENPEDSYEIFQLFPLKDGNRLKHVPFYFADLQIRLKAEYGMIVPGGLAIIDTIPCFDPQGENQITLLPATTSRYLQKAFAKRCKFLGMILKH